MAPARRLPRFLCHRPAQWRLRRHVAAVRRVWLRDFRTLLVRPSRPTINAQPNLEILIYDQDVRDSEVAIAYPAVRVLKTTRLQNPNYLFVEVEIGPGTKAGKFSIELSKKSSAKIIGKENVLIRIMFDFGYFCATR